MFGTWKVSLSQLCFPCCNLITHIYLFTKFQPRYHSKLNKAKSIIHLIQSKPKYLSQHTNINLSKEYIMHQSRVMFMNFKVQKLSKIAFLEHFF